MSHKAIERYSLSVFEQLMTVNESEIEKFINDTDRFLKVLSESPELRELFSSPAFTEQEKKDIFQTICGKMDISAYLKSLYALLIEHRRTALLDEIKKSVQKYHDTSSGITEAEISAPFSFNGHELEMIADRLAVMTGSRKIRLIQKIDHLLVGGARIRIGDKVYDASLKSMMKNLKKNIMEIC